MLYTYQTGVQSLNALNALWFGFLYSTFLAGGLLYARLFGSRTVNAILASCYSLVGLDFWNIHAPTGMYESLLKLMNVSYILAHGHLAPPSFGYMNWPSLFIGGVEFSQIVQPGALLTYYLAVSAVFVGFLMYVFASKVLGRPFESLLCSIIAIEGNISINTFSYHPDLLSIPLILTFLMLVHQAQRNQNATVMISAVVFLATTIQDFQASVSILVYVLLLALYSRWIRHKTQIGSSFWVFVLVGLVWALFWAWSTTRTLLGEIVSDFTSGIGNHATFAVGVKVSQPAWVVATEFAWIGLLVGLPGIMVMFRVLRRSHTTVNLPGLFLIATGLLVLSSFFTRSSNISVVLLYGPLAGSIIVSTLFFRRKSTSLLLVVLVVFLAAPSFFAVNGSVQSGYISEQEYAAATFTLPHYPGTSVYAYSTAFTYFGPNTTVVTPSISGSPKNLPGPSGIDYLFSQYFEQAISTNVPLNYQPSMAGFFGHLYGYGLVQSIREDIRVIARSSDLVYSNGYDSTFI
ncbi:MAG: hypothetical protein JRM74_04820 [Nitrososphaerota archaeon]|nr:hypothetical protein [Nitrososphaerota archaeon]